MAKKRGDKPTVRFRWIYPGQPMPTDLAEDELVIRWGSPKARDPEPDKLDAVIWDAFGFNPGPERGNCGASDFFALAEELDRDPDAWGARGRPRTDRRLRVAIREILSAAEERSDVHLKAERGELSAPEAARQGESAVEKMMMWGFVMTLRLRLGHDAVAERRAKVGRSEGGRSRAKERREYTAARDAAITDEMARLTEKLGTERAAAKALAVSNRFDVKERQLRRIARRRLR